MNQSFSRNVAAAGTDRVAPSSSFPSRTVTHISNETFHHHHHQPPPPPPPLSISILILIPALPFSSLLFSSLFLFFPSSSSVSKATNRTQPNHQLTRLWLPPSHPLSRRPPCRPLRTALLVVLSTLLRRLRTPLAPLASSTLGLFAFTIPPFTTASHTPSTWLPPSTSSGHAPPQPVFTQDFDLSRLVRPDPGPLGSPAGAAIARFDLAAFV